MTGVCGSPAAFASPLASATKALRSGAVGKPEIATWRLEELWAPSLLDGPIFRMEFFIILLALQKTLGEVRPLWPPAASSRLPRLVVVVVVIIAGRGIRVLETERRKTTLTPEQRTPLGLKPLIHASFERALKGLISN